MGSKGEQTKRLICMGAYRLFAEKGYKDVTMKDICDKTGLSRGGLYRHYTSTEQIFLEIISMLMVIYALSDFLIMVFLMVNENT